MMLFLTLNNQRAISSLKRMAGGVGALSACALWPLHAQALEAHVHGVDGVVRNNVVAYLTPLKIPSESRPELYSNSVHTDVVNALKAYGYYTPTIDVKFRDRQHVDVHIDKGPRTHVNVLDVRIVGEAKDDPEVKKLLADSALMKDQGKPLSHEHYEYLKKQLDTLALSRGYFDASYPLHRIEVRPWEQRADIYLVYVSGKRYRYGDVSVQGSQIRRSSIDALQPFKKGDPYQTSDIAEFNNRLGRTNWFRSVSVRPQLDQQQGDDDQVTRPSNDDSTVASAQQNAAEQHAVAPVSVHLIAADRDQFKTGIGYSTDDGPHAQFGWTRPWMNERGDSLTNSLYFSQPRQSLAGQYRIPLEHPLDDAYEFNYGFDYIDDNDTRSRNLWFTPTRAWHFANGWDQRLYVRFSQENFTQASDSANVFLVTPGVSWNRTAVDNEQFPMHGNRQDLTLEGTTKQFGSDISFMRAVATTRWIESIGDNNRFFLRGNIGATQTDSFSKMPPSLRFFAGGDSSVRGYSYETLAPRDGDDDLLGGKNMLTGTFEYQRRLSGAWWGATFYDVGNAFNSWSDQSLKRSAGVGIRWISPVGPIRFDLAHPFDDDRSSWRVHFAIGPEF